MDEQHKKKCYQFFVDMESSEELLGYCARSGLTGVSSFVKKTPEYYLASKYFFCGEAEFQEALREYLRSYNSGERNNLVPLDIILLIVLSSLANEEQNYSVGYALKDEIPWVRCPYTFGFCKSMLIIR